MKTLPELKEICGEARLIN